MQKTLVLVHREELLDQAIRQISRFSPELQIGIERGSDESSPSDDVIIGSVSSLGRRNNGEWRLGRLDPMKFKLLIIDEAHHATAPTYVRIIDSFLEKNPKIMLWGCSATFSRLDGQKLSQIFERVIFHMDTGSAIKEGFLTPPLLQDIYAFRDLPISTQKQLMSSKRSEKENISLSDEGEKYIFQKREINKYLESEPIDSEAEEGGDMENLAIDTPIRNQLIAAAWKKVAWDEHSRKATIVFSQNIQHAFNLASAFQSIGCTYIKTESEILKFVENSNPKIAVLTGASNESFRGWALESFASGTINIIINCGVLTEGTDIPRTDCILLVRPSCNPNLYLQMVGRGLRRHPEKKYCLVLDAVDRTRGISRSLISFPNLDSNPIYRRQSSEQEINEISDSENTRVTKTIAEIEKIENLSVCVSAPLNAVKNDDRLKDSVEPNPDSNILGTQNLENWIKDTSTSPGLGLAWIQMLPSFFALAVGQSHAAIYLKISTNDHSMGSLFTEKDSKLVPLDICTKIVDPKKQKNEPINIIDLVPLLIKYLKAKNLYQNAQASSFWRCKRPPTKKQKATLLTIINDILPPNVEASQLKSLMRVIYGSSMGRASDLIFKAYAFKRLQIRPYFRSVSDLLHGVNLY